MSCAFIVSARAAATASGVPVLSGGTGSVSWGATALATPEPPAAPEPAAPLALRRRLRRRPPRTRRPTEQSRPPPWTPRHLFGDPFPIRDGAAGEGHCLQALPTGGRPLPRSGAPETPHQNQTPSRRGTQ